MCIRDSSSSSPQGKDAGNNGCGWLGNITDMDGMSAFLSTDEETKWDRDNGCVYKIYNLFKMFD